MKNTLIKTKLVNRVVMMSVVALVVLVMASCEKEPKPTPRPVDNPTNPLMEHVWVYVLHMPDDERAVDSILLYFQSETDGLWIQSFWNELGIRENYQEVPFTYTFDKETGEGVYKDPVRVKCYMVYDSIVPKVSLGEWTTHKILEEFLVKE